MQPGAAIFWTVLIPGSAHLRLGHPVRAAVAFLTCIGLLAAGAAIVGDRIWYFQLFEPFSFLRVVLERIPVQLLPESANLGGTIVLALLRDAPPPDTQAYYDWLRMIRVPVDGEHLGLFLTGTSGIVAALWAADAQWLARRGDTPGPSPAGAAAMSWMLPGSGHFLAGQRDKGILIGSAVLMMFAAGLALSDGHAVDRPLRSAWWIGQSLFGGGTLFATLVTAPLQEGAPPPFMDHGVAMSTVAGFMNLVVMIDAYTVVEKKVTAGPAEGDAPAGERA